MHVEAAGRGDGDVPSGVAAHWLTRDTRAERLRALAWLVAHHPLRCLRDLRSRSRWRREETVRPLRWLAPAARRVDRFGAQHLHAHFAAGAALDALRLAALLDLPYSVMTHGYDIFQSPANLREKHERAAFAVTASAYSAAHLPVEAEVLVMGVDGEAWTRERPPVEDRTVIAVGRLVEKKGFADLVAAAAGLNARVMIVGDGPLRDTLTGPGVELLGARPHAEVRALMQDAAVLAMPCVVAADGDRDTMPVVVKEALALELPVVATDAVGLPEVVRDAWGRLVPANDPAALAAALDELLSLPADERARMGAAGRAHVLAHCSLRGQAERLAELIAAAQRRS